MDKLFLAIGVFVGALVDDTFGQVLPPIQLDRPDQTECPFITPSKYFQLETGIVIENTNSELKNYSHPTMLLKYGINEKFELRLITELVTVKNRDYSTTGINPITVGIKTSLLEEIGLIPKISFIGHITTSNVGSKEFETKYIAPSFRFSMQHTLTEKISLAYNLGAEWDGDMAGHTYIYTFTTGFSLTEKLGAYVEVYGFFPNDYQSDQRFDCGFTYLLSNDFIVDISGGIGLTENAPNNYLALGLSYRFNTAKK